MKAGDKVIYVGNDPRWADIKGGCTVTKVDHTDGYIEVTTPAGNTLWFSPENYAASWKPGSPEVYCPVVLKRWFMETEKYLGGQND